MTFNNKRINYRLYFTGILAAGVLLLNSCRKEKSPEPSYLDTNYFVIEDNPNDPIDHAIYEFYKNTGIAAYYNDTIHRKKISRENESPARYTYVKLSLGYAPLGNTHVYSEPLSSRDQIPALLNLMQTELVPKLPSNRIFPSILFVDTFSISINTAVKIEHGWASLTGFNTLGIKIENVNAMNSAEKRMYAASILAGIAEKSINGLMAARIQKEFLSVSREATKTLFPVEADIYFGLPFLFILPPDQIPQPTDIGLLFYPLFDLSGMLLDNMPREADDIRGFLTAVFYYTPQEFADLYTGKTFLLQKFNLMRNFAKEAGFKLPE